MGFANKKGVRRGVFNRVDGFMAQLGRAIAVGKVSGLGFHGEVRNRGCRAMAAAADLIYRGRRRKRKRIEANEGGLAQWQRRQQRRSRIRRRNGRQGCRSWRRKGGDGVAESVAGNDKGLARVGRYWERFVLLDIALDLVQRFPELATIRLPEPPGGAIKTLATRNSTFPSGTRLVIWQQWIYSCMPIDPSRVSPIHRDIEACSGIHTNEENIITEAFNHLYGLVWDLLKFLVPSIKHICDIKTKHVRVLKLLDCISQGLSDLNHTEIQNTELFDAIFPAIKHGNFEFVKEMLIVYPDIVWILDPDNRNLFLYAVLHRQEKIFNLLHNVGPRKNLIVTSLDKDGNSILHHAAMLSPSSHLDGISGGALQMQRELQWFKEVEKAVQPMYREMPNSKGQTAWALFTSEHTKLREEGEKWMKDTATSCTVVAALVATVMFTAAFTVPGGYNKNGDPVYLNNNSFIIFILSDVLSLFSSASSILMFLGNLKSSYTDDEFLVSLPKKLIMGISALLFSIATMMLAFATTIFIFLHHRLSRFSIPIIVMSCFPVLFFVLPQLPLLFEIFVSTYGPGIFERPKKRRF